MRFHTFACSALFAAVACAPPTRVPEPQRSTPPLPAGIPRGRPLRVQGSLIVDAQGSPVTLRGVAFGNQAASSIRVPRQHHAEVDYENVSDIGFDSVHFYLNPETLEDESIPGSTLADGWQWIDDNISWASAHGVRLVLSLCIPPGGDPSVGDGSLWTDPALQDRFIHLWRTIAERYRGVPTIAGFNLLSEPLVPSSIDQWKLLAERTIAAIRRVNPDHIVFLDRVSSIGLQRRENETFNFFRVADRNVAYSFHFYKPWHFTHQGAAGAELAALDQRYPDERLAEVEWFFLEWQLGTFDSPKLPPGNTPWRFYRGAPFTVSDPAHQVAKPVLVCDQVGSGTASFDDLVLERLGGRDIERIWEHSLNSERGWAFWSQDQTGRVALDAEGHREAAISVTGTASLANLAADFLRVPVEQGQTYRLSGWMRGKGIPRGATCQIRLDFLSSSVPVARRDRNFLRQELDACTEWGRREQVPIYLGEFGTIRASYEDDRGGLRWAEDMLDLTIERNLSFAYREYHDENMGIYYGDGALPDPGNANAPLIDLLRQKLSR